MKHKINYWIVLILFSALLSCSNDDSEISQTPYVEPVENILIELKGARDIFPNWAKFQGKITQDSNNTSLVGFVFSTNPNPIVNNGPTYTVSDFRTGVVDFELTSLSLLPNQVYYIKAFVKKDNTYVYSTESTFRTTGYFGPAGGYVGFDKGIHTDGWRYMEIHPTSLHFSSSGFGAKWGATNNFISGTYPNFGKGLENTIIIVNNTTDANCAAKLCYNLTLNGFSDWYLPSIEEIFQITNEFRRAGISFPTDAWSSTQTNANFAKSTFYNLGPLGSVPTFEISDGVKEFANAVYPARRY
jgi:hypothetical protein